MKTEVEKRFGENIFAEINREVQRKRSLRQDADGGESGSLKTQTVTYVRAGYPAGENRFYMGQAALEGDAVDDIAAVAEALAIARELREEGVAPDMVDPSTETVVQEAARDWMELGAIREVLARVRAFLASEGFEKVSLAGEDVAWQSETVNTCGAHTRSQRCVLRGHIVREGRDYLLSGDSFEEFDLRELCALMQVEDELAACPSCPAPESDESLPAVLMGRAMTRLLMTAWQSFEANAYLSGSTPFKGKLGERIAAPVLSLKDVPALACDAEGTRTSESVLVEDGVMKDLLGLRSEMAGLGLVPRGNVGRTASLVKSYSLRVVPRVLMIEEGEASVEAMIRSIKRGYVITEAFDQFHALDPASGVFHFPCRGVTIADGKAVGKFDEITLEGNLAELFGSVETVAKGLHRELLTITETFTVASPAVKVSGIHLSH